jgi:hypothetical protein
MVRMVALSDGCIFLQRQRNLDDACPISAVRDNFEEISYVMRKNDKM